MAKVYLGDGNGIEVEPDQTVLDALLDSGEKVPHSCKAGSCQSCLMRAVDGELSGKSQQGIKPTLRAQGYFLACMEKPSDDLRVSVGQAEALSVAASVVSVEPLSADVVKLTIDPSEDLDYRPGQFLNLVRREDGLVRSYSIASVPGWDSFADRAAIEVEAGSEAVEGEVASGTRQGSGTSTGQVGGGVEMHVRRLPGGRMSNWIASELREGDGLDVRGPAGECFYMPGEPEQPLLLAGTGTGLAPLWGIVRDALQQGHTGEIVLYHGALNADGLYMVDELQALAAAHPNVTYRRCLLNGEADAEGGCTIGRIDQAILQDQPSLKGWRVFLCGDPGLVNAMRKKVFLAGASMQAIYADAFLTAKPE
ncbi:MAG: 2Fe-2S iron-sulfur cluster-binding protein [Phycisphaeraceae bacterium]